jgi:hypothetical protein
MSAMQLLGYMAAADLGLLVLAAGAVLLAAFWFALIAPPRDR